MRGICCARLKFMNTIPARVSAPRRRDAMDCWLLVAGLASDTCDSDSSLLAARFVVAGSVWPTNLVKPHVLDLNTALQKSRPTASRQIRLESAVSYQDVSSSICKLTFCLPNHESRPDVIFNYVV
ncbi:hypothetical protein BJX66DRAFT_240738 [Aspergillus keveii]|uniref:Uncharacterized protein n=1 Tax=Aspergillus keveii TaxID=714993 RepID=A0ABR4G0T2_9EURO